MAQVRTRTAVARTDPPPNVYTALMGVAGLVLLATTIVVLVNLLSSPASGGYGLSFSHLFGSDIPGISR